MDSDSLVEIIVIKSSGTKTISYIDLVSFDDGEYDTVEYTEEYTETVYSKYEEESDSSTDSGVNGPVRNELFPDIIVLDGDDVNNEPKREMSSTCHIVPGEFVDDNFACLTPDLVSC